ncbi:MAG: hypothetical protein M3341_11515 [Actinomycetota bacterium]|nr:hypothetical protein [Actinomycetota bacterium]
MGRFVAGFLLGFLAGVAGSYFFLVFTFGPRPGLARGTPVVRLPMG